MKIGFKKILDSHNIIHAIFILSIKPLYIHFGIETRYNMKVLKEMATIYARLVNQYKFRCHTKFSARFHKINEDDQGCDEIEVFNILIYNQNLTESDINNIDVKSHLVHKIRIQETKDSGGIFDEINSMRIGFYKTDTLNRSSYAKIPLRSSATLKIEIADKNGFL